MKIRTILTALLVMLFATAVTFVSPTLTKQLGSAAFAADDWDDWDDWDEEEEEDAFGNIMETTFATIDKVDFVAPKAGAPADVSVKVTLVDEDGDAKIVSVKLVYFLKGDYKAGKEVELKGANGVFKGQIPGQPAGTKVDFVVRVEDSNGNVTSNAVAGGGAMIKAVPDIENSRDIVPADADLITLAAGYDNDYLYVDYSLAGKLNGGTLDPPYLQLYGIKITNPDTEQGEGLMVGKLWINLPLATDKEVQNKFLPMLMDQGAEYVEKIGKDKIEHVMKTGMMVLDIQKLMGGNIMEGMLFAAEPTGKADGGKFSGKIKRAPLGNNPSGYLRIITLTAANASIDSFMPIPLNCSNFLTIYTNSFGYTVQ